MTYFRSIKINFLYSDIIMRLMIKKILTMILLSTAEMRFFI